jgi:hypothetical protein
VCIKDGSCPVNPRTRNDCRFCRYHSAISAGMSREGEAGRGGLGCEGEMVTGNSWEEDRESWTTGLLLNLDSWPVVSGEGMLGH